MKRPTFTGIARELCRRETGARQVNIADMSETLARTLELLDALPMRDVHRLCNEAGARQRRRICRSK